MQFSLPRHFMLFVFLLPGAGFAPSIVHSQSANAAMHTTETVAMMGAAAAAELAGEAAEAAEAAGIAAQEANTMLDAARERLEQAEMQLARAMATRASLADQNAGLEAEADEAAQVLFEATSGLEAAQSALVQSTDVADSAGAAAQAARDALAVAESQVSEANAALAAAVAAQESAEAEAVAAAQVAADAAEVATTDDQAVPEVAESEETAESGLSVMEAPVVVPDFDIPALEVAVAQATQLLEIAQTEADAASLASDVANNETAELAQAVEEAEADLLEAETRADSAQAAAIASGQALAAAETDVTGLSSVVDTATLELEAADSAVNVAVATAEAALAYAAEVQAGAEEAAAIEAALMQCHELAGPPDAGVAVTEEAQEELFLALEEAEPHCAEALERGSTDPEALFTMGAFHQLYGEHEEALERFEQSAEAGQAEASTKLGDYHLFGIGPLRRDPDRAVAYFRAGAEGGDPAAIMTLGLLHRIGMGVPRDTSQMIQLMRQAADGGYHFAQFRLGQIYLTGEGIPGGADESLGIPDRAAAARYLSMAAEQGNIEAVLELAKLHSEVDGPGTGDPEQQFRWTQAAVEAGFPDAISALGFLYERGRGVDPDPEQAAALYVEALETGEVDFDDIRGEVGGRIPAWDRDTAIAFQLILQERGLYEGAIDGIIGRGSRAGAEALADE